MANIVHALGFDTLNSSPRTLQILLRVSSVGFATPPSILEMSHCVTPESPESCFWLSTIFAFYGQDSVHTILMIAIAYLNAHRTVRLFKHVYTLRQTRMVLNSEILIPVNT